MSGYDSGARYKARKAINKADRNASSMSDLKKQIGQLNDRIDKLEKEMAEMRTKTSVLNRYGGCA